MEHFYKRFDFRSDTVTVPTQVMREAMYKAEVGDDVLGEDPTIQRLERLAADKVGKEAALFVTSGTQGNLVAVLTHTKRGDEVILESEAHIYYYEVGGMAALGGVIPRLIEGEAGIITPEALKKALRGENIHFPSASLLCLENSHNRAGGAIWTPNQVKSVAEVAQERGLHVHVDGARLFNAAIAQNCEASDLVAPVDSVMFCLSKGLGAPVGSMLAGSAEFINRARKMRKMLGGGMRQAGILAAAGIVALESMTERLGDDHSLALKIGQALSDIPNVSVDLERLKTNIVLAEIDPAWGSAEELVQALEASGEILAADFGPQTVRFVTHKDVGEHDAAKLIETVKQIMEG
ncbi:low-specificity L-threonine aldolase [Desulfosporosinus sp. Sb-LF]|uniref:low-specificity L-threonine aldolase n=1 Tax=Desulfosporosinus sp. Sb-LF TaxID=2560027 RepID=UPI00107EEBF7|nr:low-specificity L-threonine aldolase [Desulfosporosinus sp. Sb-LF]TGE34170.1 low-specificity L-threonine aldolase [Desulfosporosinus sp. Sb-LF]